MELFASSIGLARDKPWAAGVATSALCRVSELLGPVSAPHRFNVAICFDDTATAIPRIAVREQSGDCLHLSLFFPAAAWPDRAAARPLAESAIVSCLFDAADQIGVSSDSVLQHADAAGIDINVAETVASDGSPTSESKTGIEWDPLFTSTINELGPLGNDTGADTHAMYQRWRADRKPPDEFLGEALRRLGVRHPVPDTITQTDLEQHSFDILTHDDAVIGLAFSQQFTDGVVTESVRQQCLAAIQRQSMPIVLRHRRWASDSERLEALAKMEAFVSNPAG